MSWWSSPTATTITPPGILPRRGTSWCSLRWATLTHRVAWPSVGYTRLLEKIRAIPDLTVHTIGMGTDIDERALRGLAQAGNGIYVNNGRGASIEALFARVTREFTTIQSSGATIPNPSGDHEFTWQVTAKKRLRKRQAVDAPACGRCRRKSLERALAMRPWRSNFTSTR